MKIPIFVSCPTDLNPTQVASRKVIMDLIVDLNMEPRALGRSDYPVDYPLKEVYVLARHCSGGIVLGFEQLFVESGTWKRGSHLRKSRVTASHPVLMPTPWNQIEAGMLYSLGVPLLVFRENGITGGIFDLGTSEMFVHTMPSGKPSSRKLDELRHVLLKWHGEVSHNYYKR